jgi:sucrose-6-phosphate hydrolase SacC (GH32 family)
MWYSGGETYEPDAIGYATSKDGIKWDKHPANPIFTPDDEKLYEQDKVTACQVIKRDGWYLMFYIGFEDVDTSRICIARSPDGITRWERNQYNPIISSTLDEWDGDGCYKPFAVWNAEQDQWLLWYNGRKAAPEYIGLVTHKGYDLGFSS